MNILRKLSFVLLALCLVFAFCACGGSTVCDKCFDGDGDGLCDTCKNEMPKEETKEIVLFENDEPLFQIVLADDLPASVRQAVNTGIKAVLRNSHNIILDVVTEGDKDDEEIETEILIGEVNTRDEKYVFDAHELGEEGYAIRMVDSKILINAGSEEKLAEIITSFANDVLLKDDLTKVVMTSEDTIERKQTGYKITAVKVNGNDMRGYTIATDLSKAEYKALALEVQDTFYARAGYWFKIVDIDEATEKSFIIKSIPKTTGADNYKIYADGTQLIIECAYDNMLSLTTNTYLRDNFLLKTGEIDFKGTVYTKDISVLYYEDFGAKGDGKTDDFKAMYDTHVMANKGGQTVLGKPGAEYYIFNTRMTVNNKETPVSIPIRTTTDWQGAKIIIDDRPLSLIAGDTYRDLAAADIFQVLPNEEHASTTITNKATLEAIVTAGLNPNTTNINFKLAGWDGALMIVPYDNGHKVFRRRGYSQHSGEDMHELIIIDKDGNVSEETPIMFEYTNLTKLVVYKLDPSTAITVGNATIETLDPNQVNHMVDGTFVGGYTARGMTVYRSYTTVHDINHVVVEGFTLKDRADGICGPSANGMFKGANADHVTFKNCIIPGRQAYGGSSYNFRGNLVNKIVLDGCIQSNFWVTVDYETGVMTPHTDYVDGALTSMSSVTIKNSNGVDQTLKYGMHWGIGGTNYCKNMEYINSKISRFDAHAGLYNGKIIGTSINGMELTGVGDLIIEDTDWYQYGATTPFLYLRADYGYHWDGDILIKNTNAHLFDIGSDSATDLLLAHYNYVNWYFGYTCAFPNITVDNLDLYSTKTGDAVQSLNIRLIGNFNKKMHLAGDIGVNTIFDYVDANGDGFIDELKGDFDRDGVIDPIGDMDNNGVEGQTSININDQSTWHSSSTSATYDETVRGITHPTCTVNVNPVKPPSYFKVINNDGVDGKGCYTFNIPITTYKENGKNYTGFFGETKFIYGDGENDFFIGTDHQMQKKTKTFSFYK